MSRLPFEAFLAFRYLRPRRTFVSVITVISIIGVLLGVAVLIVVISVMTGFDEEWRRSILGFNSHMKVFRSDGQSLTDYQKVMKEIAANPQVTGVAPFIRGQVVANTRPSSEEPTFSAPILLGVDQQLQDKVSDLPKSIVEGEFDLSGNGLVIGHEFASGWGLHVGDRVEIYAASSLAKMRKTYGDTNAEAVLPQEFTVTGVFDVGFSDYNRMVVVSSLEMAQELYELDRSGGVHGLQVMLKDPFQADAVAQDLYRRLDKNLAVVTWKQESRDLFNALVVEKNMMFYLLFFIMIVAGFGIVNCQITFVVQKTREIGILKAIGASNRQVLWLFLSQSVVVGVIGVGLGYLLALLALAYRNEFLGFMRQATGMELLPSSIYQLPALPASTQPWDVVVICGTAFLTCVLAGLFPAWKASRMQPVEALRYE